jgi:hypothetical protein
MAVPIVSIALILFGGAIFSVVYSVSGWTGVVIAACILLALELVHDVRGYRKAVGE